MIELIYSGDSNPLTNYLKAPEVQLVSCSALLCSNLIQSQSKDTPRFISELTDERTLKYLRKLLSTKISKSGNLTVIEGSTFGFEYTGLFDGAILLVEKLIQHVARQLNLEILIFL